MNSLSWLLLCLGVEYKLDRTPTLNPASDDDNNESEEGDDDGKAETLFVDKDVEAERSRIMEAAVAAAAEGCADDAIVIRKLRAPGVHAVSFGVPTGGCFGLLGPENSGKSSVLAAVAGHAERIRGDISANGTALRDQQRLSLYYKRSGIAYCPRRGEFSGYLTGREHLELFAALRMARAAGRSGVKDIVQHALRQIRLTDEADKQVGSYGTDATKKLWVATALLPGAPLVLLDEPTEGASMQARRAIWAFIRRESSRLGKTVLLATGSMAEAEELCSTIGVMTNGVLQSLGSMKKLKHKFSNKRYIVSVDLEPSSDIPEIEHLISSCCQNHHHKDKVGGNNNNGLVQVIENYSFRHTYVLKNLASLADLFDNLEKAHLRNGVRNYIVSQASLESVFFYVIREHDEIQENTNNKLI